MPADPTLSICDLLPLPLLLLPKNFQKQFLIDQVLEPWNFYVISKSPLRVISANEVF